MDKKGFVLRDIIIIMTIPIILGLIVYAVIYNIQEDVKEEDTRDVAQNVEQGADMYYKNFILRPEDYSETFFELDDPSIKLRRFIVGRKPESGEVYIRPIDDIKAEISMAVYYGEYCAIKYYGDKKFKIRKTKIENCVLDKSKLKLD